jgi:type I restriction enzyme, S subunit
MANNNWKKSTWGDEVVLEYGKALRGYDPDRGLFRVFGSNGPIGWTSDYLFDGPGVILGRKGAYRGVEYSDKPFFVIDTAYSVKPLSAMNMRWLYYAVKYHKLGEIDDGSPIPSTTRAAVYVKDLEMPVRKEQDRIADILGTLDDKIELNRRTNETLEAMAKALFKSWFVDFDPVREKAAGRQPPGLDTATAKLFHDSFEDSPLGPVPKGWRVSQIGDEVEAVGGSTPSTDNPSYWNGTIPFATPKDLSTLSVPLISSSERAITEAGLGCISSGLLPVGTVLLSSRAPIGYLAITTVPLSVNQGFVAMKCTGSLPNYYVLQWARQNMETIIANANGTTFLEISKKNFRPITVLVPDKAVLSEFVALIEPLFRRIASSSEESRTLAATRDALLPKLLSGEVSV